MSGFKGTSKIETSTANQELIPEKPYGWTIGYKFKSFSFFNDQECHIIVNNGEPLFLRAGMGFNSTTDNQSITSFVIVEEGISYNWIGAF